MVIVERMLSILQRLPSILLDSGELGIIYAIMALGVFISFRTLNTPDLTVDGSFVLGAAVGAVLTGAGHPFIGIMLAFIAGALAGSITSLLNTRLGIHPLLSGILVMLGLYSVNLRVMGSRPNIPLGREVLTLYNFNGLELLGNFGKLIVSILVLAIIITLLFLFLKTRFGFVLRATGDNEAMVRASGVNTNLTKLAGLAMSNGLVGLSGAMLAQYQKFTDIQMGTGMVVIGLASVIIGEVVFGTKSLLRRLGAVALGSVLYRIIIAIALEVGMPAIDLKLVSAFIVALALSATKINSGLSRLKKRFKTGENGGGINA